MRIHSFLLLPIFLLLQTACSQDHSALIRLHTLDKGYALKSLSSGWESAYYDYLGDLEKPVIAVALKNKFGAINTQEEVIVPLEYEFTEVFDDFIVAHDFPGKHDLFANISVFDYSGKLLFKKLLFLCQPINQQLIFGAINQRDGLVLDTNGNALHECDTNKKVEEILPNIFRFYTKQGDEKFMNEAGKLILRPIYLPRYLTFKHYESDAFMVVKDEADSLFLVDKNFQSIDLPQGYTPVHVEHNFALLQRDTATRETYEIYDIAKQKILTNTISHRRVKVHKCPESPSGKIWFDEILWDGHFFTVDDENEIQYKIKDNYSGRYPLTEEQKYIFDICEAEMKRFYYQKRAGYSAHFDYYIGKDNQHYFQHRDTKKIYQNDSLILKSNAITSFDKYSMIQKKQQFGLINENFEIVIPPTYTNIEKVGSFNNKYFVFQKDKRGVTDAYNNVILQPEYDKIQEVVGFYKKNGWIIAEKAGTWQVFSFAGVPLNGEVYTKYSKEKNMFVEKPIELSNAAGGISIDAKGRWKEL